MALVFQHRHTALLFRLPEITHILRQKPQSLEPEDVTRNKKFMKEFQAHLSTWSATGLHQAKTRFPGLKKVEQQLKHLQNPPKGVETHIKEFPPEFQIILEGFCKTTFNWFTCPKGNNTEKMRIRFANHLLEEAQNHLQCRQDMLYKYPELYNIRMDILKLINDTYGLASFDCWTTFNAPDHWSQQQEVLEFEETIVSENSSRLARQKAKEKLSKAFDTLVQTLTQEDLCGVLKKDQEEHKLNNYVLHPNLGRILSKLYNVKFNSFYYNSRLLQFFNRRQL